MDIGSTIHAPNGVSCERSALFPAQPPHAVHQQQAQLTIDRLFGWCSATCEGVELNIHRN